MKLQTLRLSSFQSCGAGPTDVGLEAITYLIGLNGSGKTAALQALCRLFAFAPSQRRIQRSDFHVPFDEESFVYVLDVNPDGSPFITAQVPRGERKQIHVHYLPARRDRADQIAYGANALLDQAVRIMTMHKSKGLEFDSVSAVKRPHPSHTDGLTNECPMQSFSAMPAGF